MIKIKGLKEGLRKRQNKIKRELEKEKENLINKIYPEQLKNSYKGGNKE